MSDKGKTGRGEQQPRAPGDVHDVFEFAWFTQTFIMLLTSVDAIFSIGGCGGAISCMNVWRTDKGEPEEPGSANTKVSTEDDYKRVKNLIQNTLARCASLRMRMRSAACGSTSTSRPDPDPPAAAKVPQADGATVAHAAAVLFVP